MASSQKPDDQYSPEETQKRMEAALRGARIAGPRPMESLIKKKPKASRTLKKTAKKRAVKRT
jgi:hypothetical protein